MDVKEECLEYLDMLRDSGVDNMFGAAPYLQDQFDLTRKEARGVLADWMMNYSERRDG